MITINDEIRNSVGPVSASLDADVLFFSGDMDYGADREVVAAVTAIKSRRPNILLVLSTFGGSADVSYKIARTIRQYYPSPESKILLYVDTYCKSAGMLLAMCADEMIMSDMAELGPLDVQVRSKEEVGEYSSGLTPVQALDSLRSQTFDYFEQTFVRLRFGNQAFSTRMASQIAADMTIGLFRPIYEQMDPMRLGENGRAMNLGMEYASRVCCENVRNNTALKLVGGYPSHGFVIDRKEAATLFIKVRVPSADEQKMAESLQELSEQGLFAKNQNPLIGIISTGVSADEEHANQNATARSSHEESDGRCPDRTAETGQPDGPTNGDGREAILENH